MSRPPRRSLMTARSEADPATRVAVLTPSGGDGPLAVRVLGKHGIAATAFTDMRSLCGAIQDGIGVLLMTEEALVPADHAHLLESLVEQPPWSDVPIVLLVAQGELSGTLNPSVRRVAENGNVTLLERPVRVPTLTTALQAALKARARQFETRDDLARRARSEQEIHRLLANERTLRALAEDANMAKMQFLATMSHELRTPLNAIGGHVQLMELEILGPITEKQKDALQRVHRAGGHLLGLINDVLNFAKIEAGRVTFNCEDVSIGRLFEEIDGLIEPQMQGKKLTYSRPPDCDAVRVTADLEKARQVILNLLSNAVKFTPGGGRVDVRCNVEAPRASITISDTGVGIAESMLESVFEPFVQVRADASAMNQGTGLGLAISRDLARAMGGDLTAVSTLDAGSTFHFWLPLAPAAERAR